MKYMTVLLTGMCVTALVLAGCGAKPLPVTDSNRCIGLADDLATLHAGDELPRVLQVMGMPKKAFRAYVPFGFSYDVLEYPVVKSGCMRAVLHIDDKLQILFDNKGRYMGYGDEKYLHFRRMMTFGVEPLMIDPVVLEP